MGCVTVFGGCLGIGLLESVRKRRTLQMAQALLHGIEIVEREITLNARPMPDALDLAAGMVRDDRASHALKQCAASAEKGICFTEKMVSAAEESALSGEWCLLLAGLCDLLGRYDAEGQARAAEQTRGQLQSMLEREWRQHNTKSRLYMTLGAAAGGVLAVLLV